MSEIQPAPVRPQPERPTLNFAQFQEQAIAKELRPLPSLEGWYREGVKKIPEMTTTRDQVSLSDIPGITTDYDRNGEGNIVGVKKVANSFMEVEAVEVAKDGKVSHSQPALLEATKSVHMTTEFGEVDLDTSAFVGVVLNKKGQMLAGFGQEPLADTPNHVVVKTPLQTSTTKWEAVFGDVASGKKGDPSKDPAFFQTIQVLFPGQTPEESAEKFLAYINQPDVLWPMGPINGNRLRSPNSAFVVIADESMEEALLLNGINRWITVQEKRALERCGIMNTIASAAFDAALTPEHMPHQELAEQPDSIIFDSLYAQQIQEKLEKYQQLWQWIEKRRAEIAKVPYIVTHEGNVANGKTNVEIRDPKDPEHLKAVKNGGFYTYEGLTVATRNPDGSQFGYDQGVIRFATEPINLIINGQQQTLNVGGIIFALADERGNYLLTVGQQPTNHTPQHEMVQTFQASISKLQRVMAGESHLDPTLAAILPKILGEKTVDAFLQEQYDKGLLKTLATADGGRLDSMIVGTILPVKRNSSLHKEVELFGVNRWTNPREIAALEGAAYLNNHALSMLPEVRKQRKGLWRLRRK